MSSAKVKFPALSIVPGLEHVRLASYVYRYPIYYRSISFISFFFTFAANTLG